MIRYVILISIVFFGTNLLKGQRALTGKEIAQKSSQLNEGVHLSRTLTMELTDKRGKSRVRETVSFRKYFGEEKRLAIFYETPTNIKGTAFLVYDYPDADRDDDQWLYIPALRKTRRISAANRGDYFLGTDLTYEDIKLEAKLSAEDYTYKAVGTEKIDGRMCYVVEGQPVSPAIMKELGYSKVRSHVDAEIFMVRRIMSWDEAGNLLKTVDIKDIRKVQDIWTFHLINVENHKTKHRTVFRFEDIDYRQPISDDLFTEQALVRGI